MGYGYDECDEREELDCEELYCKGLECLDKAIELSLEASKFMSKPIDIVEELLELLRKEVIDSEDEFEEWQKKVSMYGDMQVSMKALQKELENTYILRKRALAQGFDPSMSVDELEAKNKEYCAKVRACLQKLNA